jgi:pectate lyase
MTEKIPSSNARPGDLSRTRSPGVRRLRKATALSAGAWLIALGLACGDELPDPPPNFDGSVPPFGGVANPPPVEPSNGGTGNVNVGQGGTGVAPVNPISEVGPNPELIGNTGGMSGGPSETPPPDGDDDTDDDDGDDDDNDDNDDDDTEPPPVVVTPPPVVVTPPPVVVTPPPGDCNTPPAPSLLEGWASVAGRGVNTTTGGGNATPIVVTTLAQLQNAVLGNNPAVIHVRGELAPGDIRPGSNKTIIGLCGAEIHGHLEIREVQNVIVRNITIVGYGEGDCSLDPGFDSAVGCSSGDDAVIIQRNAHHVWFDHCSVRDGTDGNLDISNAADFVTISWTKFSYTPRTDNVGDDATGAAGHRYSNLVGGTDNPSAFDDRNALNVTWHHNWWADNVVERQPRIRFGQNHLFNNYYSSATSNYCIRAGIESAILLEGNVFDGSRDPHEFNSPTDEGTADILLGAANLYTNTTGNQQTGGGGPSFNDPPYDYRLDAAAAVRAAVTSAATGAGPH